MKQTEKWTWPFWEALFQGSWGAYSIEKDEKEIRVDIDLPGACREDISLSSRDGNLHLTASRQIGNNQQKIRRQISIPEIDGESLSASLQSGVLEIRAERGHHLQEIEIQ